MTYPEWNLVLNVVQACFLAWLSAKYRTCSDGLTEAQRRLDAVESGKKPKED